MSKFGIDFHLPTVAPPKENTMNNLTRPIMGIERRTPLEVWQIMCDRITNAGLATSPPAPIDPISMLIAGVGEHITNEQGASILKLAIERVCPDCQGACYVANPHAYWDRAEDGAEYCNGPEDTDCETCHGLGFVMPRKPEPPRLPQSQLDDDMPF